ncbi:hypothetical protein BOTBODRAFT_560345 [Botryobasidium botryosum FD-172 SS1]|uniref:Uncharacterized protein n=1 Tax=Botryobasidium botryosum (strain FD-172 SS1) TaxID=930990 RepID=A0A067MAS6_BOTB1|nr:hypothetical protein BOTBODRAFT_560345 [Botryobasidium botryosum FD-172 SS1]
MSSQNDSAGILALFSKWAPLHLILYTLVPLLGPWLRRRSKKKKRILKYSNRCKKKNNSNDDVCPKRRKTQGKRPECRCDIPTTGPIKPLLSPSFRLPASAASGKILSPTLRGAQLAQVEKTGEQARSAPHRDIDRRTTLRMSPSH